MTGGESFFGEFIEDYYAECDEHLATARRVLLALEDGAPGGAPDPALLRELHRALHTLKGLAGMVGDADAERLAHAIEDALREAERASLPFAEGPIDALFAGVDALDRCVAARRSGHAAPDVSTILTDLARGVPHPRHGSGSAIPTGSSGQAKVAVPAATDSVYHFAFAPTVELNDRGVGVDAVRARLRALGTLLDAKPRMESGGLVFDFRVSVAAGYAPDDAWMNDGMSWSTAPPVAAADAIAADVAPPVALEPAAGTMARGAASTTSIVRVDLARLDDVMRLIGDLVVSRSRIDDVLRQLTRADQAAREVLEETNAQMERQIRRLREGIMRIRLVPVSEVFDRLRFAARDAIRESGKRVTLVFHGQSTEIDKQVVDRMLEPLLHVVRNAVIHGIESPHDREAAGKPAEGTLTLRASAAGDRIVIEVEDDGRGVDVDGVVARARARGLLQPGERVPSDGLLDLLCAPGLSTREAADMTSGRGVGMDVVRSSVRALAGDLSLHTVPGRGSRFIIEVPLTLMIVDALLVEVSGQQMAVPQPVLREIVHVDTADIVQFEDNDVMQYRGGALPIVRLAKVFALDEVTRPGAYVLVVGSEAAPMGLLVDRLLELREIVVHPVTDPLVAVPGVGGATELGDGRVSLILDTAALVRLAHEQREQSARARVMHVASRRSRASRAASPSS